MEKLHKEPDVRRQDYNAFINELKQFHQNKGTVFRHLPRINGREIDLFTLYNQVTAMGGWQKVNDQQKWDIIVDVLKLPKACVNSSLALRQLYISSLWHLLTVTSLPSMECGDMMSSHVMLQCKMFECHISSDLGLRYSSCVQLESQQSVETFL